MGILGEGVAGHEDDASAKLGPTAHQREEENIPRDLLEMEVEQHEIDIHLVEHCVRQMGVACRHDLVVHALECPFEGPANRRLVVDDQDARAHEAA